MKNTCDAEFECASDPEKYQVHKCT